MSLHRLIMRTNGFCLSSAPQELGLSAWEAERQNSKGVWDLYCFSSQILMKIISHNKIVSV